MNTAAVCWGQRHQQSFSIGEMSQVGELRRGVERLAQDAGFGEVARGRAAIIASELATNIVRHAGQPGEVLVQLLDARTGESQLELLAIDRGSGMDVDRCLRDGFSTAGTAGNGLGAVNRLATVFDIYSAVGNGTVVLARIARNASESASTRGVAQSIPVGAVSRAVAGEIENGDAWRVSATADQIGLLVVDGLGHGPLAASAANAAAEAFLRDPFADPVDALGSMHRALVGSRGAAASCVHIDLRTRVASFAGVGNISVACHADGTRKSMGGHNGTLGVTAAKPRTFQYPLPHDALLLLNSDGLQTRWSFEQYPGLSTRHPATIAAVLYARHARQRDDVTVLAVRVP
ncbi:MAG: rsbT 1 [Panacagrimonas sp.]|jgi:anti-sigma regulatory factor (Ser/Thr protein kinase)|nr:ATP-binding SpoIIE family protein phosphatase [Panacagrimonas sp.]MCC2658819.1 rsbT 1 [Panacagrimonas sp.]